MTTTSAGNTRRLLQAFDFSGLFVEELGWDRLRGAPLAVEVGTATYRLQPVAEKAGMAVYRCSPDVRGAIPDSTARAKIEQALTRQVREHLLIFTDRAETAQLWQWVRRDPGKPDAVRTQRYQRGQSGERLLQRLEALRVSLAEEEAGIGIVATSGKARQAFDVERVTKRFYERFDAERKAFLGFIRGLDGAARDWYAALMLNRLMFIYFIQKKGFLDGDRDYLRDRLRRMQAESGPGRFLSFYRHFLLRLFHEGLGQPGRTPELDRLLGDVPYLNGGLFDEHQLEREHPDIQIPDDAFARVFDFFDAYEWHLDDRPLRADNEINPDVLGYIFEKYINQKQMGAYYTKEDITEYIGKNTILPHLLTAAEQRCSIAFAPDGALWRLLREQPDRYLYDAVRHGVDLPLPPDIAAGLADVSRRGGWNRPAAEGYALPTETWREHVARRTRCLELRQKLRSGQVHRVDDLITLNLDIRQFAQDAIAYCEGPELLRALFQAIRAVTVLDPTCGSGAFLFAALNILEPLYEACLERMQGFIEDADRQRPSPGRYQDFRAVLRAVEAHPSRRYYILKQLVLNNLYGVDIMDEAVEICKLRLFLKLVAQVETAGQIEPLPDIDFNIRAGNTLVGFASLADARRVISGEQQQRLLLDDRMAAIEARLSEIGALYQGSRDLQTTLGADSHLLAGAKRDLRQRQAALGDELDHALAVEYGIDRQAIRAPREYERRFAAWRASHKPFHWIAEFYRVMSGGGFNVVIGNPPYVEYSKVRGGYSVVGYRTLSCGNLYAMIVERSLALCSTDDYVGLIVPLSLACTERTAEAREGVLTQSSWVSSYDIRPSSLFNGVAQRLCIMLTRRDLQRCSYVGGYRRWSEEERTHILELTTYTSADNGFQTRSVIPKIASHVERLILSRLCDLPLSALNSKVARPIYVHRIVRYFVKALPFAPLFVDAVGSHGKSEDYKEFRFVDDFANPVCAILNSSLFYWYWRVHGDGFHCGYGDVYRMCLSRPLEPGVAAELTRLQESFTHTLKASSRVKTVTTSTGRITYQEFYPKKAKPITDEIDTVLARHYGFTDEELDFIINYDIKYRMGAGADDSD